MLGHWLSPLLTSEERLPEEHCLEGVTGSRSQAITYSLALWGGLSAIGDTFLGPALPAQPTFPRGHTTLVTYFA